MKKICILFLNVLPFLVSAQQVTRISDPVKCVNPLMGTDSKCSLLNGNIVKKLEINSKSYDKNWPNHAEGVKRRRIELSAMPDKTRGTREADFRYSFSIDKVKFLLKKINYLLDAMR